jgi:hypothetical protein
MNLRAPTIIGDLSHAEFRAALLSRNELRHKVVEFRLKRLVGLRNDIEPPAFLNISGRTSSRD